MTAKKIAYDSEAREHIRAGVRKLAQAVKVTLGPRGRNVIIEKSFGSPTVTKDGVTVAKEVELEDSYENMGAQMVKEVASKTSDVAGDGTTTATVLAEAIFEEGLKNITAGANPVSLKRGIEKAVSAVAAQLGEMSREVEGREEIAQVGAIASNNDPEIGEIFAKAMDKVGTDGVITIEEGKALETEVEWVEGMQFDKGYLSPHFVTNVQEMEVVLDDPYILIHEKKIASVKDLVPVLEKVAQAGKPLLIIAEDVEGEALATFVVNKLRGVFSSCAVKAPGFGDRRKAMLGDIEIMTGGKAVFEDMGRDLASIELEDLGRAKKVLVTKDATTIIEGAGTTEAIQGRIAQIKAEIERPTAAYASEKAACGDKATEAAYAAMHECCAKAVKAGEGCCGKDAATLQAKFEKKVAYHQAAEVVKADMHKCCATAMAAGEGCCGHSAEEIKADYDKKVEVEFKKVAAKATTSSEG